MICAKLRIAIAASAQFALAVTAHATDSLDLLLDQVRSASALAEKADAAREQEFLAARAQQALVLAEAEHTRDAALARSQKLSAEFDLNEARLGQLETVLATREGNLGELFGVTRQVSGDVSDILAASLTSAEFPGRGEFFSRLATAKSLPSIGDLEQLWFEMLREMTETGRVARFETGIASDDTREQAEVVRIGDFVAMSAGRYLVYSPGTEGLRFLPRQPSGMLQRLARRVEAADSGYVRAIVDPSRGLLLSQFVQRPNFWERIQHGESIGYIIIAVGVVGLLCAAYQSVYLLRIRLRVRRQLVNLGKPVTDNPLGRVLARCGGAARNDEDMRLVELRISEAVRREVPLLERFQALLRLAVAAGPLLGLVGTVIGMIITFQSITQSGSSDPKLMANGIGQAMIATVLGLGVAIPLLFANAGLTSLSRSIVQVLDEQSNGLLAQHVDLRSRIAQGGGGNA